MNRQDDSFVGYIVNLREIMTFILIDKENISRFKIIKPVVDKKLLPTGDGKIDLIAVMNMDLHRFFIIVQMSNGKRPGGQTGVDGFFTGRGEFHNKISFHIRYVAKRIMDTAWLYNVSIKQKNKIYKKTNK